MNEELTAGFSAEESMILLTFSESLWLLSAEHTEVREGAKQGRLKETRRKMTAVPQTKYEGGLDQVAGK